MIQLLFLLLAVSRLCEGVTLTVTNANPAGAGSLANAISTANNNDTIEFNIPGTPPFIITPATDLPDIDVQVTIDGYSQPGAALATPGSPAIIAIEIQAPDSTIAGLHFAPGSSGSLVRGLAINSCTFTPAILVDDTNITITGNYIGMDANGTTPLPNMAGVIANTDDNNIGGASAAQRNVIAGVNQSLNANPFVRGSGGLISIIGSGNIIQGNYIGTNKTGTATLGVSEVGVYIYTGNTNQVINNLISGNIMAGIVLGTTDRFGQPAEGTLSNNTIENNIIGLDVSGIFEIPNGFGISICSESNNTTINANIISGNRSAGIQVGTYLGNINRYGYNPPITGPTIFTNNLIGAQSNGKLVRGNHTYGVVINEATSGTSVGGVLNTNANLIVDNDLDGISISSLSTGNNVHGNYIGINKFNNAMGNKKAGVAIGGLAKEASNNTIGI